MGVKVLVVEDEDDLRQALVRGLRAEHFVVQAASNGVDGLWMAREFDPAVVVLDIMKRPGTGGDCEATGEWSGASTQEVSERVA